MELLLIIGAIWLFFSVISGLFGSNQNQNSSHTRTNNTPSQKKQNPQTFRPSSRGRSNTKIVFNTDAATKISNDVPTSADLEGLHDAFTGAPLDPRLGLYQCKSCNVYYHTESLQVLREANNSQCASCHSTNIVAVVAGEKTTGGKDYTPNIVTLDNYKLHEGSVVTFEGFVHKVNESKRGNDFAVMFENKSWVRGFKLVFFRGAVSKVGGASYIKSLDGKKVKVRGLIVKHKRFGYEIIVSEKSMILSVK